MDKLTILIEKNRLAIILIATLLSAFAIYKFGECMGEFLYYILH